MIRIEDVTTAALPAALADRLNAGYRVALVSAAEDVDCFRIVYVLARANEPRSELVLRLSKDDPTFPSLARLDYGTGRFEREIRDLFGLTPTGHPLPRRLVHHSHWPEGWHPMRADAGAPPPFDEDRGSYPFLEVTGPGVYEIPVGPIHAGLIEPGHFRFSVVGETILRMKARLWFLHRGVERLFQGRTPGEAIELAERISGDTAVGHTLAFVTAVEDAHSLNVAEPDRLVRALLLEMERMYNHVTDLGALANDVGYGIANAHAQRIRERLLRLNQATTGHRLLRGGIIVGGTTAITLPDPAIFADVTADVAELAELTLSHGTVRDRFAETAVLKAADAGNLGTLGYVARASGQDIDARRDHPSVDLGERFSVVVENGGDVMARYLVRLREFAVSTAVASDLVGRLDGRTHATQDRSPTHGGQGVGLVEGWRGTIATRVELDDVGRLSRVKVVDPSFFNWPALSVALADTIVPDFPLANKSFNQSYAGNDL